MKLNAASLEGVLVLLCGVFMAHLVLADNYWLFLNPKFTWLTGGASAALILAGGAAVVWPRPQASRISMVLFSAFLALACWSTSRELSLGPVEPPSRSSTEEPTASRTALHGVEYTRINTAELFSICEARKGNAIPERFVLRGFVLPGKDRGPAERFVVARIVVVCCLADAVAVGFEVQAGSPTVLPADSLEEGQWVQVFGRLEPLSRDGAEGGTPMLGPIPVLTHPAYLFVAEHLQRTAQPDLPFIFEFRDQEPFAY
jgi:hypothetical protein